MTRQMISVSPDDLGMVARALLDAHPQARIFAFYGSMGSGKTTFIKALCKVLGVADTVNSPSFAIVNQYISGEGAPVFHFDFYRIKKPEEALDIGYEDYFFSGYYNFVEWPEKIEHLLPGEAVRVDVLVDETTGNRVFEF
jgi:tRNA threonylcarbamoyladenosine biosynthesis protein TsaE